MVQTFEDLVVWQKAKSLSVEIYTCTNDFPKHELLSLTNQIRRAAVSIAANIAEGSERRTSEAYAHHLDIAIGLPLNFIPIFALLKKSATFLAKQKPNWQVVFQK